MYEYVHKEKKIYTEIVTVFRWTIDARCRWRRRRIGLSFMNRWIIIQFVVSVLFSHIHGNGDFINPAQFKQLIACCLSLGET